jgi:hypothetical protein
MPRFAMPRHEKGGIATCYPPLCIAGAPSFPCPPSFPPEGGQGNAMREAQNDTVKYHKPRNLNQL